MSPPSPAVARSPARPAPGVSSGPVSPHSVAGDSFSFPQGPIGTDDDDGSVFSSAVQPNDRGKATALGAFHKPSMPYDDQQYSQRQFQLQQARERSPPVRTSSSLASEADHPSIRRRRDGSDVSSPAQSTSSSWRRDQSVSSQNTYHAQQTTSAASAKPVDADREPTANGTFFAQSSGSEDGSEAGSETEDDRTSSSFGKPLPQPLSEERAKSPSEQPDDEPDSNRAYTAYSPQRLYKDFTQEDSPGRSSIGSRTHARNASLPGAALSDIIDADSPTLGPASGLSGLVRAHLRNDSGQSSIYPATSPVLAPGPSPARSSSEPIARTSVLVGTSEDTHDSTWDLNGSNGAASDPPNLRPDAQGSPLELEKPVGNASSSPDPISAEPEAAIAPPLSLRAKQILDQAAALRDQERLRVQQAEREGTSRHAQAHTTQDTGSEESSRGLDDTSHQRTESTETAKERHDFATELSNRRQRVQDNLKGFAEAESRSGSPMPGTGPASQSPSKYANAFGPFKSRPNKGSLAGRQDPSFKAMKMLGISGSGGPTHPPRQDYWNEEEQRMPRDDRGSNGRSTPSASRSHYINGAQSMHGLRPSPHFMNTNQDHAHFEQRSRGGNGRDHDNVGMGIAAGARINSNTSYGEASRSHNNPSPQKRSPDVADDWHTTRRSPSAVSGKVNTGTSAAPSSALRSKSPLSSQTNNQYITGFDPESFPGTPATSERRPLPENDSPTMPVPMSPTLPARAFQDSRRIPNNRKKSVNKSDISDPTFLSGTSSVNTMKLHGNDGFGPRGQGSGRGYVPPLPPINPRRKTAQQAIANVFGRSEIAPPPFMGSYPEPGRSVASDRNGNGRTHVRQRLRKTSSDGANLGIRARQQALLSPPPTIPQSTHTNDGMF